MRGDWRFDYYLPGMIEHLILISMQGDMNIPKTLPNLTDEKDFQSL